MKDIDVFLLLRYGPDMFGIKSSSLAKAIYEETKVPMGVIDVQNVLATPPRTKHLVHALADKGFSPSYIQHLTGLAQSTVSYHLNTEPPTEYINPQFHNMRKLVKEGLDAFR